MHTSLLGKLVPVPESWGRMPPVLSPVFVDCFSECCRYPFFICAPLVIGLLHMISDRMCVVNIGIVLEVSIVMVPRSRFWYLHHSLALRENLCMAKLTSGFGGASSPEAGVAFVRGMWIGMLLIFDRTSVPERRARFMNRITKAMAARKMKICRLPRSRAMVLCCPL